MFLILYFLLMFVCVLISFLFVYIGYSFFVDEDEKLHVYECGFEIFDSRDFYIFDFNFFCIAVLFLLVELEIFFIFFWITSVSCFTFCGFFLMFMLFCFLIFGYEYLDLMLYLNIL